ncbi:MAG: RDD family protein [Acidimicrobiia bacterium]|nr:RDD family protein [Acidimicrobiia bacterium]
MSDAPQTQPPGWYYAQGDPPGTQRYWDGQKWEGGPQPVPGAGAEAVAGGAGASGLAEPVMRLAGRLIDYVVWIIIVVVFTVIFIGSVFVTSGTDDDVSFVAAFLAGLLATLAITAYETVLVGLRGQTLGKMAVGTKVVRADGSPADMRDGFIRISPYLALGVLGSFIPFLPLLINIVLVVVSIVFLFTDPNRQAVWDKIAKTIVVNAR